MWLLIFGLLILILASFLHSYCAIGTQALLTIRPMVFDSLSGILLQIGWIILFLIGVGLLFVLNWSYGIIAIILYWFVLPLLITPIMKRYMLPPWDKVKDILEKLGYTKNDYLRGDWWKDLSHRKSNFKGR